MSFDGFDPKFSNFPDYILKITEEIWEGRGFSTLDYYYAEDLPVRSPSGIVIGKDAVKVATAQMLVENPDRVLLGEDIIWSRSDDGHYLSSHRIVSTATQTQFGPMGHAAGKKLVYRSIADCAARADVIDDEWLVRDYGGILLQLGHEPREFVAAQIEAEGGPGNAKRPFSPAMDVKGPYKGRGNDNEYGQALADILNAMMNAEMSVIATRYDRAAHLEYAGNVTAHGHAGADAFWLPLRAAFPNATFTIHHQIGRDDPMMPPRAAIRWSLDGLHEGWGPFGAPTGAHVHVMGITHAEFGPYGLRREWTIYDQAAVWRHILLHQG
ncbi:MAG: ester cyclase [Pseudomonadota bacterium]